MFSSELTFCSVNLQSWAARSQRPLLHLDAAHGPSSLVAHGAQTFLNEVKQKHPHLPVERLSLWDSEMRSKMDYDLEHVHLKLDHVRGGVLSHTEDYKQKFANIEEMAAQIATAAGLLVSVPMWNYGVPYVLKQYFDCILHPGLTFKETASGPRGLLSQGRPLAIVTSSGGGTGKDFLCPWLQEVGTMLGFDVCSIVRTAGVAQRSREDTMLEIASEARVAAAQFHMDWAKPLAVDMEVGCDTGVQGTTAEEVLEWDETQLLDWLRAMGGVSEPGLETLASVPVTGTLWLEAGEDDWRNEELDLDEKDIQRLMYLRERFAPSKPSEPSHEMECSHE